MIEEERTPLTVSIDGKEYSKQDLTQQQFYLVRQIRSCQLKAAELRLELNQLMMAEKGFTEELREHFSKSNKEKGNTSSEITDAA